MHRPSQSRQAPAHGTAAPPPLPANRSMPTSGVIPVLHYDDVPSAVEWLCAAFDCSVRLRIGSHRAQLRLDGGAVVVAERPAAAAGLAGASVMVRVRDVDAHHRRAVAAGARVSGAPVDYPYGERQYTAVDPAGHCWTFSQTIADVDPASWGGELAEPPAAGHAEG